MIHNLIFWGIFNLFIVAMLAIDLGVVNRRSHVVHMKEAIGWSIVWISLAGLFALAIAYMGHRMVPGSQLPNGELALQFVTGYVIELSLSVDNLFVFLVLFRYFHVPAELQHKVLFWGIIGALVMRASFILAGVALINRFEFLIYVFGGFLVYVGFRLLFEDEPKTPNENFVLRMFRRAVPVTSDYQADKFFVMKNGMRYATPLMIVLLTVETTDVIFAVDSIPAILAITRDAFIVYTSNVFAILGLRSMFFALAGMMRIFHLLHYGLAVVLMFIGAKMLASHYFKIPIVVALGVVIGVLTLSVVFSLLFPKREPRNA